MRLLLDTHAIVWWSGNTDQLGPAVVPAVLAAEKVWLSAVSVYELSLKHHLGKLPGVAHILPRLDDYLVAQDIGLLALSAAQAAAAGRLPLEHRDPFDRMLAAQALTEDLVIVSRDTAFDHFGVRRLW